MLMYAPFASNCAMTQCYRLSTNDEVNGTGSCHDLVAKALSRHLVVVLPSVPAATGAAGVTRVTP